MARTSSTRSTSKASFPDSVCTGGGSYGGGAGLGFLGLPFLSVGPLGSSSGACSSKCLAIASRELKRRPSGVTYTTLRSLLLIRCPRCTPSGSPLTRGKLNSTVHPAVSSAPGPGPPSALAP
eukprot:scaffold81568_cov53-Phaeocystis_antarctica.AAC.2